MKDSVITAGVASAALVAALSLAAPVRAEGVELTFGLGIRAQTESNPAFDGSGRVSKAGLDLSFGLTSETALSKLTFGATGMILSANGPGNPKSGLTSPSVTLNYTRATAGAELTVDASATDTDLASNSDVTNFTTGRGTQRNSELTLGLNWGKIAPLGFGLTAGVTVLSYPVNPDGLASNRTTSLGATTRADLSPVLHLNLGVTDTRFTQAGAARDTLGLLAGLTIDRKNGTLSATLTNDHTPEGDRTGLSFGHEMTLPSGTLSYAVGATHSAQGKTYATGSFNYAQELTGGDLTIGLDRAVTANADTNLETVQSSASLAYRHAVTQTGSLAVSLNWAEQRNTGPAPATAANTSLSATWIQDLTPDWALDLGYTHRLRDQASVTANSDAIFFELRREFTLRP